MRDDLAVAIVWQVPPSVENVRSLLSALQDASDDLYRTAHVYVLRKDFEYSRIDTKYALEKVDRGILDLKMKDKFPSGLERWGVIGLAFHYSPLMDGPCALYLSQKNCMLQMELSFATSSVLWQAIPVDDGADVYIDGVLPQEEEMWETDWTVHFEPGWPKNARMLMDIVNSVKGLFPVESMTVAPEFINPEEHSNLALENVVELTSAPPDDRFK